MTESQSSKLKIIIIVCGALFVLLLIIALNLPKQSRARSGAYKNQANNYIKNILLGIYLYRDENNDKWPEKLEEIESYIDFFDELTVNPFTHDNPGYEYVKPSPSADPSKTVVLYQLRDGKRDISLHVGFGDGRVLPYPSKD